MTGITKDMSGSYDCITSNDISPPDVRTVQVTVNCPGAIHDVNNAALSPTSSFLLLTLVLTLSVLSKF
ncbi:hypothetical protein cypCar_00044964 [Cyprinus carpio]|nr:hypothetical protein cypCar_00044964 [Cyprinus carpio]